MPRWKNTRTIVGEERGKAIKIRERTISDSDRPPVAWVRKPYRICTIILLAGFGCAINASVTSLPRVEIPGQNALFSKKPRLPQLAAQRHDRLQEIDPERYGPIASVVEANRDGSTRQFIYHHVGFGASQSLKHGETSPLSAFAAASGLRTDPFANILAKKPGAASRSDAGMAPKTIQLYSDGHPIRSANAFKQDADRSSIERVVAFFKDADDLAGIVNTVGVPAEDLAALRTSLASTTHDNASSIEFLLSKSKTDQPTRQVILYRIKYRNALSTFARDDRGNFKPVSDPRFFELVAKGAEPAAMPTAENGRTVATADDDRLLKSNPEMSRKLIDMGIPAHVAGQIGKLALDNNIEIASDWDPQKSLEVLFRTDEHGISEPVEVTFEADGGERHFYRYRRTIDSEPEFFDEKGQAVSRFLDKKPVPNGRLGDGFAWRTHPILGVRKHHDGVDYAAPYGSPILAAADGVVSLISYQAGYGKYIRVQHDAGYMTTYAHISGTPKALHVGQRVSQGQVIAFVGSTGLSTGPHLYYELRKGDQYLDPTHTKLPAGPALQGETKDSFFHQIDHLEKLKTYIDFPTAFAAVGNLAEKLGLKEH